ncbi:MAG: undecaprenyldiphospho-muramoylpentapeptide beta-N-acetylglucosaminyltransferase [Clostridia bacterium]|nr:undecaprenyldiphospho-muramoylpentapeptide beta-N-acetylglucosaminyltransferase [Clostridia bacterium]
MQNIVLTGGGTAGHVYPALAVAEHLKEEFKLHYIGSCGMEKEIVGKEPDIVFHEIEAVKLQRKLTLKNLLIPFKLLRSISKAKKILHKISPAAIFSKGGYVSLPVVIAAHKLNIPIVSHESDLTMGLANKIILRYCDCMCTAFEKTAEVNNKCVFTGQPIRKSILTGKKENLSFYKNLDKNMPTLLIVGGSSGAEFLNKIVKESLDKLCEKFNVVHICGKNKIEKINHKNYFQLEYAHNMGDVLDAADYVISRAGSGAINEFLTLNKPMLLIPLSKSCSRGDQIENAKLFANLGYCEMLEEEEYDEDKILGKLDNLMKNDKIFKKNMKKTLKTDTCTQICKIIKNLIKEKRGC